MTLSFDMTVSFGVGALRRSARLGGAGVALFAALHGAAADDSGAHQFFSSAFGGASAQSPAFSGEEVRRPSDDRGDRSRRSRPLTVQMRRDVPTIIAAQGPSKPAVVAILDDATLQRGDAVMTAQGIRIFVGEPSDSHAAEDFVSLDEAKHLSRDAASTFAALDRLPRG